MQIKIYRYVGKQTPPLTQRTKEKRDNTTFMSVRFKKSEYCFQTLISKHNNI